MADAPSELADNLEEMEAKGRDFIQGERNMPTAMSMTHTEARTWSIGMGRLTNRPDFDLIVKKALELVESSEVTSKYGDGNQDNLRGETTGKLEAWLRDVESQDKPGSQVVLLPEVIAVIDATKLGIDDTITQLEAYAIGGDQQTTMGNISQTAAFLDRNSREDDQTIFTTTEVGSVIRRLAWRLAHPGDGQTSLQPPSANLSLRA